MLLLLNMLDRHDLFIDVGANIGTYTLLAAGVKRCSVISFEPNLEACNILKSIICRNHLEKSVSIHEAGLGAAAARMNMTTSLKTRNHLTYGENQLGEIVEIVRFDDLNVKHNSQVIKVDIEGFEFQALQGMNSALRQKKILAIIVEVNNHVTRYGSSPKEIYEYLVDLGYILVNYSIKQNCLNRASLGEALAHYNQVYVRDVKEVNLRLDVSGIQSFIHPIGLGTRKLVA